MLWFLTIIFTTPPSVGGRSRRHFDLNVASRAKTEAEIAELDSYLQRDGKPRYYPRSQSVHSEVMRQTAFA